MPTPPPRPVAGRPAASRRRPLAALGRSLVTLNGEPEQIARGAAIGVFVAFTPTVGFQMLIAAVLATWCRASRPVAVVPVWITNPLTIPPIFALTYQVGRLFVTGPDAFDVYHRLTDVAGRLTHHGAWEVFDRFGELLGLGGEVFIPMCVGCVIVGAIAAGLTYLLTLSLVRSYRQEAQAATV